MNLFKPSLIFFCITLFLPSLALAEATEGGDGFRKAAQGFLVKAQTFDREGHADIARGFRRLAEIKKNAALKADRGEWDSIDWTEYRELNASLKILIQKTKIAPAR